MHTQAEVSTAEKGDLKSSKPSRRKPKGKPNITQTSFKTVSVNKNYKMSEINSTGPNIS